jgi:hypothetical protein
MLELSQRDGICCALIARRTTGIVVTEKAVGVASIGNVRSLLTRTIGVDTAASDDVQLPARALDVFRTELVAKATGDGSMQCFERFASLVGQLAEQSQF